GGGRLSPKVTAMPPGPYSPTASTTSGVNLMMLYWGPDCVEPELISPLEGPESDRIVHPLTARSNAHKRDFAPRPSILTFEPALTHAFRIDCRRQYACLNAGQALSHPRTARML